MIPLTEVLGDGSLEILEDVAARGSADAASGLSEMVGRQITISTPRLSLLPIEQVPSLLDRPEDIKVGVYLGMGGDVKGHILLLFAPAEAARLVDMLMDVPPGTTTLLGSMERSALGEVGNLTGSFFMNALADFANLSIQPSPPAVIVDMGAAVLDIPLVALAASGDEALVINTLFVDDQHKIDAIFLVMPDLPSLRSILAGAKRRWSAN